MTPSETKQNLPEEAEITYAQAVGELETILDRLEQTDIDVDLLSEAVERAAWLLTFCRRRIHRAETRIREILTDMEESVEESVESPVDDS